MTAIITKSNANDKAFISSCHDLKWKRSTLTINNNKNLTFQNLTPPSNEQSGNKRKIRYIINHENFNITFTDSEGNEIKPGSFILYLVMSENSDIVDK